MCVRVYAERSTRVACVAVCVSLFVFDRGTCSEFVAIVLVLSLCPFDAEKFILSRRCTWVLANPVKHAAKMAESCPRLTRKTGAEPQGTTQHARDLRVKRVRARPRAGTRTPAPPPPPIAPKTAPQVRSGRSTAPIGPPMEDELRPMLEAPITAPAVLAALAERLARESWYVRCSGCSE